MVSKLNTPDILVYFYEGIMELTVVLCYFSAFHPHSFTLLKFYLLTCPTF